VTLTIPHSEGTQLNSPRVAPSQVSAAAQLPAKTPAAIHRTVRIEAALRATQLICPPAKTSRREEDVMPGNPMECHRRHALRCAELAMAHSTIESDVSGTVQELEDLGARENEPTCPHYCGPPSAQVDGKPSPRLPRYAQPLSYRTQPKGRPKALYEERHARHAGAGSRRKARRTNGA
jgi:hypothetical protein